MGVDPAQFNSTLYEGYYTTVLTVFMVLVVQSIFNISDYQAKYSTVSSSIPWLLLIPIYRTALVESRIKCMRYPFFCRSSLCIYFLAPLMLQCPVRHLVISCSSTPLWNNLVTALTWSEFVFGLDLLHFTIYCSPKSHKRRIFEDFHFRFGFSYIE